MPVCTIRVQSLHYPCFRTRPLGLTWPKRHYLPDSDYPAETRLIRVTVNSNLQNFECTPTRGVILIRRFPHSVLCCRLAFDNITIQIIAEVNKYRK